MLIKIKFKRNKLAPITPENLKDVKELYCIKDYLEYDYRAAANVVRFSKGSTCRISRRNYSRRTRLGNSFTVQGSWKYWVIGNSDVNEHFVARLINRRKPKNDENTPENKESGA